MVSRKPGVRGQLEKSGTLVELVHTGWERRPDGARAREGYDTGWNTVLNEFVRTRLSLDP